MPAYIVGTGMCVPETEVTNDALAPKLGLSSEKILTSSGILRRRWATAETKTSDLAVESLSSAIADAKIHKDDIDFLLLGTMTPDRFIPGTSYAVQNILELREIPCLDIRATCCNMLYGLHLSKALINSGEVDTLGLCLAEVQSRYLDISPPAGTTSMLFGDGSSALIIASEKQNDSLEIIDVLLASNGQFVDDLGVRSPGTEFDIERDRKDQEGYYPRMNGQSVIINASRRIVSVSKLLLERNNMSVSDISWIVPHQANQNLLTQVARSLQFPVERVLSVIENYGNTSSASMGIALDVLRRSSQLQSGEFVLLPAFGAGFTWGAALCKMA